MIRRCQLCNTPLVSWHNAWLCLHCDNRGGTAQAEWALDWAREQSQ